MKLFTKYVLFLFTFVVVAQANIPSLTSSYDLRSSEYGVRYYDPRTSVWQSPDPILDQYFDGKPNHGIYNPENLQLYTYAANNPVVNKDPNGEWIWKSVADLAINVAIGYATEGKLTWSVVKNAAAETVQDTFNPAATVNKAKKLAKVIRNFRQKQQNVKYAKANKTVETDSRGNVISREPKDIQDSMTLDAAKKGASTKNLTKERGLNINDHRIKAEDRQYFEKHSYRVESKDGKVSDVHYLKDTRTGITGDHKFESHVQDKK